MPSALVPLRHAPFRWLALARTVSQLGNAIAPVALAFAVLDLGRTATELGVVVAARTIPNLVLLLVGGVIADRMPRRVVLVGASALAFASQGAVAALVLTHTASLGWLIVLGVVNGSLAALSFPASQGVTPQTVPAGDRRPAVVLLRLGSNFAGVVGAAAGGALVAWIGSGWGIAVDAATFGLAAIGYALMGRSLGKAGFETAEPPAQVAQAGQAVETTSPIRELIDGWREFTSREWVWVVVAQFLVVNMCFGGGLTVLGPVIADETFGRAQWGLVLGAETLGLVVGSLVAMRWRPRHPIFVGVALILLSVAPLLALALWPVALLIGALFFLAGIGVEQFEVAWDQSLQHHVPHDRLSRVYSYDALGSFAAIPLGQLLAGPLADATSPRVVLIGAAVLTGLVTLAALSRRSLRAVTNA